MMRSVTVPGHARGPPADLYLDLLARCLTRDLFLDEEVRNVDLRDLARRRARGAAGRCCGSSGGAWCGRGPTGRRGPSATTGRRTPRRWSGSPASPTCAPASPPRWPTACPATWSRPGVWRGGTAIYLRADPRRARRHRPHACGRATRSRACPRPTPSASPSTCRCASTSTASWPSGLDAGPGQLRPLRAARRPGAVRAGLVPRHAPEARHRDRPDRRAAPRRRHVRVDDRRAHPPRAAGGARRVRDRRRLRRHRGLPPGGDRPPRRPAASPPTIHEVDWTAVWWRKPPEPD